MSINYFRFFTVSATYSYQDNKGLIVIIMNIHVCNTMSLCILQLCDFGSAKEFDHTTIQTGTGTYRWIAPEVTLTSNRLSLPCKLHPMIISGPTSLQVLKGEQVSLSCDVFSYGMVLFEIFAEEVPFAGTHNIKVASMILEGEVGCSMWQLTEWIYFDWRLL